MSKRLVLALTFVLILMVSGGVMAQTEIEVWYHSGRGAEREVTQDQVERFNEMQDEVQVKLVELPEGSYNEQVQSAAVAGDLPDVLDLDGPYVANYAWSGFLHPLEDFMSEEMKEDFLPSIMSQGTYNDHVYALGAFDSGLSFWGNKKYLEAVDARIPTSVEDAWTYDEFMQIVEDLQELEDVKYALDFKMFDVGEWYTYGFSPFFQAFGADLIDREAKQAEGTLNGEKAVEAGEWFKSLFENGYANENPPGDTEFINEEAALSWTGHWNYNPYKEALGDDLVLLPAPKFEKQATGMGSWAWSITNNSENPEAAWKFLEFVLDPENIVQMTDANGAVPARSSAVELSEPYKEGGDLDLFVEQLETIAVPRPVTPAYPVITDAFTTAVENFVSGGDVEEELNNAAREIDEEFQYLEIN
ncbi:MAG: sugar ABC transporter substrate-binding protein [Halanaerobium sp.]